MGEGIHQPKFSFWCLVTELDLEIVSSLTPLPRTRLQNLNLAMEVRGKLSFLEKTFPYSDLIYLQSWTSRYLA